jgi:Protein of unknown function (DUF3617)
MGAIESRQGDDRGAMRWSAKVPLIALLALAAGTAAALEVPSPKPGLWEQHVQLSSDGRRGDRSSTARTCMQASVMAESRQLNADYNRKNCTRDETRQAGGEWTVDRVCKVGSSTMTGHEVTRFSGEDAYHTESTVAYDPPFSGQTRKHMIVDAKWVGACPAS